MDTAFWGGVVPGNQVRWNSLDKLGPKINKANTNKRRLLPARAPAHDPGWSGGFQVFPHPQRRGGVPTLDGLRPTRSHEATAGHRKCPAGEHIISVTWYSICVHVNVTARLRCPLQFHAETEVQPTSEQNGGEGGFYSARHIRQSPSVFVLELTSIIISNVTFLSQRLSDI